jgi:hypothetical protein
VLAGDYRKEVLRVFEVEGNPGAAVIGRDVLAGEESFNVRVPELEG